MTTHLQQRNFRVVNEHYSLVPRSDIPRATFNRSHELKTTIQSGLLIPFFVDEVLPGDVHTGHVTIFARLGTLLFPLMDTACIETQFFFVPMRIVWTNSRKFWGEQDNPGDNIGYTIPQVQIDATAAAPCTIWDYFGIPGQNQLTTQKYINALIPRAYNLVYDEWYRDQNLQNSVPRNLGDGPDPYTDYTLLRRNKRHDYFTSALPWPQKNAAVTIPLGGSAPVRGIGSASLVGHTGPKTAYETGGVNASYATYQQVGATNVEATQSLVYQTDGSAYPNIYADLSQASAASINLLRLGVQTQKYLERDARGGTRYVEQLRGRWGLTPQDARLQRPEYIGGGSTDIQTAAIAQTAPLSAGSPTPLGNLAGQATVGGTHSFTCVGYEHGYILGLMSLMTRPTYQQGIHRMWTRATRFDFATPEFAALGEQAIRVDEIYATGQATDTNAFGYQERYGEYRFANNRISGLFRSQITTNIDEWHLAQQFSTAPTLGDTFIKENAPFNRVLTAGSSADNQQALVDVLFSIKSTRPLPAFGIPGGLKGTF